MKSSFILSNDKYDFDVIIVGGGLAGLVCAIELGKAGKQVLLVEKKAYPYHKVCGEYVSNEVLPYLQASASTLFIWRFEDQQAAYLNTIRKEYLCPA